MPRKKKKSKNKKQKKDVEYDKDKAGSYSISELEAFSETLLQEVEVIDQELKARQSEREMYSEVSDLLNIEKVLSALYEAKSTVLLNFSHISLDLSRQHRELDQQRAKEKIKDMEVKLRNELEAKMENLKNRVIQQNKT
jgi:hypothetical protein